MKNKIGFIKMLDGFVDRDLEKLNLFKTKVSNRYRLKTIIFLVFLFSISNCSSKKSTIEPKKTSNKIDEGFELCHQASKLYQQNGKPSEALIILEDGLKIVTFELDNKRNSDGNLPKEMAKYESNLANYLGLRKVLREQNYINNQRKTKKSEN